MDSIPYFYIIKDKLSGKMYAGCRYARGCTPSELLKIDGYLTSSTKIKRMIEENGISSFEIIRIDTNCDGMHPIDYETLFLEVNDCSKNERWLNFHNNSKPPAYGSEEFKEYMLETYGVDNINKLETTIEKRKLTKLEMYGDPNFNNVEKSKQTRLKRYSDENGGYIEVNNKRQKTKLMKYGDPFYFDVEKRNKTNLINHGVEYPLQSEEIKERTRKTNMERYGYDNPAKSPEVKQKAMDTYFKKTGYKSSLANPEIREKSKRTCVYCGKRIDPGNYAQYHGEKCKFNKG